MTHQGAVKQRPNAGHITLVGGGARSGKSGWALELARARGQRRAFIATAQALDEGMRQRIARHQRERPDFITREAPQDVRAAALSLFDEADVVVIDCVTIYVSNRMLDGQEDDGVLAAVDALVDALKTAPFESILVTNEVGMSVHPETALGRRFCDLAGWVNQRLAGAADELYLAVMGAVLRVRPGPVAHMRRTNAAYSHRNGQTG